MSPYSASGPSRKNVRRRRHPNWPLRLILLGLSIALLIGVILVPIVRFRLNRSAFENGRWDILAELMLSGSMTWFIGLWLFFFGACLGSFLNVVAWRLPNRLTLLGNSRCPYCFVPIETRYNVPILGWFALRGRCAACRLPISPRYFVVEIVAGLLLLWLVGIELATDGRNLGLENYRIQPLFRTLVSGRFEDLVYQDWSLVWITVIHATIGYSILTAGLMKLDRLHLPVLWQWAHWVAVFVWVGLFWQAFQINSWSDAYRESWIPAFLLPVDMQLLGAGCGFAVGKSLDWQAARPRSGLTFAFTLIGIGMGVPAVLSIGWMLVLTTVVMGVCFRPVGDLLRTYPLFAVLLGFVFQISIWGHDSIFWPHSGNSLWLSIIALTGLVSFRFFGGQHRLRTEPATEDSVAKPVGPIQETTSPIESDVDFDSDETIADDTITANQPRGDEAGQNRDSVEGDPIRR